ncbi:LEM domain-containing protein Bocksbeutel [Drosophila grimshawi]|uniref:GH19297 n=1 Tax=Drosophila grimshawi TaxID=7222 RepID=B4JFD4_DROGR|nr:LEM domain-containing protein Bocksbeutel [Drosophila grimshawi]EDV93415.1 GH19297 [Drosophila grimshawi]
MSELSYLEMLTNRELHVKCLEYGLPNIPVTDSSRRVILRRLHAAISGVPLNKKKSAAATKKAPKHVEPTIVQNSKPTPSAEASKKRNTIAAAKTPSYNNSNYNNNNNNSRRTIADTPSEYYPLDNASMRSIETTTTVSDVGSQSEDDDYHQYSKGYSTASVKRDDPRLRRSVSLTKSGVVTTSYVREVQQPHQPQYEEEEEEVDLPQSYTYHRPQVASPSMQTLPVYQPHIERSYAPGLSRQSLTQTQLNSTSYSNAINEQPAHESPRNTYSGSAAPFHFNAAPTFAMRQRQTVGDSGVARGRLLQPTYQVNTLYPQLNDFYDQPDSRPQPMDVDTDSESEQEIHTHQRRSPGGNTIESPYVSQFSRQLDARKRSSPLARPQIRSHIKQSDPNGPMQQFRELMRRLDQQYHLKFYFYLTLCVLFATFVYVIVTP